MSHSSKCEPRYSLPQGGRSSLSTKPGPLRLPWVASGCSFVPNCTEDLPLYEREKEDERGQRGQRTEKERKQHTALRKHSENLTEMA